MPCWRRQEAREFLDKQRESSDARVRAHRDSGCGSSETTPTCKEAILSSSQEGKDESMMQGQSEAVASPTHRTGKKALKLSTKKKKAVSTSSVSSLSPSLQSPTLLSPSSVSTQLVQRCKNVKVSLTKCDIERRDDRVTITPADKVTETSARNKEDAGLKGSFYSFNRRKSSTEKKEVERERVRQSGVKDRAPATRTDSSSSNRTACVSPVTTDILVICDTRPTGALTTSSSRDVETLKSSLFGDSDSDSDCIMLPSSCSSAEEEIMNISFEDALRGVEVCEQRRQPGVVAKRKKGEGRKVAKGKERVKEKAAGERRRERIVSGKSSSREMVREKGRGRQVYTSNTAGKKGQRKSSLSDIQRPTRRSSSSEQRKDSSSQLPHPQNSSVSKARSERRLSKDDECSGTHGNNPDDLAFKPDSQSLVNLSAIAKSNQPTSTSLSSVRGQRSHQAPPPSSSAPIAKPSYTIFQKKEVNVTGILVT